MPPSKYQDDVPARVRIYAAGENDGCTLEDLGEVFGVTRKTIQRWMAAYPDFKAAVEEARAVTDHKVVISLFKRATGYDYTETEETVEPGIGEGKEVVVKRTVRKKRMAPDTTACIFWLTNRLPAEWKHVRHIEGTMNVRTFADLHEAAQEREEEGTDADGSQGDPGPVTS